MSEQTLFAEVYYRCLRDGRLFAAQLVARAMKAAGFEPALDPARARALLAGADDTSEERMWRALLLEVDRALARGAAAEHFWREIGALVKASKPAARPAVLARALALDAGRSHSDPNGHGAQGGAAAPPDTP